MSHLLAHLLAHPLARMPACLLTAAILLSASPVLASSPADAGQAAEATDTAQAASAADEAFAAALELAGQRTAESRAAAAAGFAEAVRLYRSAGLAVGQARALGEESKVLRALGETETALARAEEALALDFKDPRLRADLLNVAATLHSRSGDQRAAISRLERALEVLAALPPERRDPLLGAQILNSIGAAHQRLGEQQEAIEAFRQVLAVTRRMGVPAGEAVALTNLANSHYQLGELEDARRQYAEVVEVRRRLQDTAGEARALGYQGWVEAALGLHHQAVERFTGALAIHREVGDRRAEADTLAGIAFSQASMGSWQAADESAARALALARESGELRIVANALLAQGAAREGLGRPAEALASYRRSLAVSRQANDRWSSANSLARIARLQRHQGDLAAAREAMYEAVDLVEALRSDVTREALRTSFLASRSDYYRFLVDVLMEQHQADPASGHAARALAVHERGRARSLLDLLAEAGADIRQGVDPELLRRETELLAAIEEAEARVTNLEGVGEGDAEVGDGVDGDGVSRDTASRQLAELLDRYQALLATLRAHSPRYAALAEPEPLDADAIRHTLLDPDTLLLEIALGEDGSHLWAVGFDELSAYPLPARGALEAEAVALHSALSERNRPVPGETAGERRQRFARADAEVARRAGALSEMILAPVAAHLSDHRRLVVVADGALQYVPFGLLPHPGEAAPAGAGAPAVSSTVAGQPLLASHEIVNLPSASVLAVLRREAAVRRRAERTLAVFADPVFGANDSRVGDARAGDPLAGDPLGSGSRPGPGAMGGDLPDPPVARSDTSGSFRRLRFSGSEAQRIAALVPPGERWVANGFEAARSAAVSGRLADFRLVHFATHAVVDDDEPHRTGLVLSMVGPAGEPANGFLRLHDIYQLDLAADLVTLSACETAHGREIQGEGLVGLVRGFMYAGAERVVASQWSVEDRATAALMERFYRAVLEDGLPPAAALRRAQLALRADPRWSAPYYWAPFVLQGEWR